MIFRIFLLTNNRSTFSSSTTYTTCFFFLLLPGSYLGVYAASDEVTRLFLSIGDTLAKLNPPDYYPISCFMKNPNNYFLSQRLTSQQKCLLSTFVSNN